MATDSAQSICIVVDGEFIDSVPSTTANVSSAKGDTSFKALLVQWDVTHFAIPIAFAAFAAMWKTFCRNSPHMTVPGEIFATLWFLALLALVITLGIYIARLVVWPGALRFDFHNPKMVNFFYTPVIIGCLLTVGAPDFAMSAMARTVAFYIMLAYQAALSIYLYGEWLFGSVLIDFVHPVVFMQVIGFFLLANLAASLFLIELGLACMSIGGLYWILIFVSNFQHTSTALRRQFETPQPTFFLFIAPPAQAAIAMFLLAAARDGGGGEKSVSGLLIVARTVEWPVAALVALYIDLFIYAVIARIFPSFWRNKFAIVWWAYIFPLSAAASATVMRARGEPLPRFWTVLSGILVTIATIAMLIVFLATLWGIQGGQLPKNERALSAYQDQKNERTLSAYQDQYYQGDSER